MSFRLLKVIGVLILTAMLVLAGHYLRLWDRALLYWQQEQTDAASRAASLWLPDYQVEIERLKVEGVAAELSALTYDSSRGTLFSVTNRPAELVELSTDGKLLRRIALTGFHDPEAVEYIEPGVFVISDERDQRLVKVHVDADTRVLRAEDFQQLQLGLNLNGNKGFEGLAYDSENQRLYAGKERDPISIYEIKGFPHNWGSGPLAVQVLNNPERDAEVFMRDLSSLDFDSRTGHLLAMSDESKLLLELDEQGRAVSALSLRKGNAGLKRSIPQAEGVTVDDQGNLYIVSEPNLFYKFVKPAAPKAQ